MYFFFLSSTERWVRTSTVEWPSLCSSCLLSWCPSCYLTCWSLWWPTHTVPSSPCQRRNGLRPWVTLVYTVYISLSVGQNSTWLYKWHTLTFLYFMENVFMWTQLSEHNLIQNIFLAFSGQKSWSPWSVPYPRRKPRNLSICTVCRWVEGVKEERRAWASWLSSAKTRRRPSNAREPSATGRWVSEERKRM